MAFTSRLATADSRLGNLYLGQAGGGGGGGGGGGALDPSAYPVWYTPLGAPDFGHRIRRDLAHLRAVTVLGDVARPDSADQLSALRPVWHTALAQPDPRGAARRNLAHLWTQAVLGDVVRPNAERVDLEMPQPPTAVGARRRPGVPPLDHFSTDAQHLLDPENVLAPAWDRPMSRVVLPRRPAWPPVPDSAVVQDEVFPQDPVAYTTLAWHTPMPHQPPGTHRPAHWLPGGVWLPSQALAAEQPHAAGFVVEMGRGRSRGWILRPFGAIDMDPADRAELIRSDAFVPLNLPVRRKLKIIEPVSFAVIVPSQTTEAVHADSFIRVDAPVVCRRYNRQLYEGLVRAELIIAGNFEFPLIPRVKHGMLSAGLWRARM